MLSVYLIVVAILCAFVKWLWNRRDYYKTALKLPGPLGLPFIGMIHRLAKREDILEVFTGLENKYGSLFYSWLGPFPFLVTTEPQYAQDVLTSPHCVNKAVLYQSLEDGISLGLLTLNDPEWSVHRKFIKPAFSHTVLKSFIPIFNRECDRLVESLRVYADKSELDILLFLQEFTLNIATRTTMGKTIGDLGVEENKKIVNAYKCIIENMASMCFSPWLKLKPVQWLLGHYKDYESSKMVTRSFVRKLFREHLQNINKNNNNVQNKINESDDESAKGKTFIEVATDLLKSGHFTLQNVEDEAIIIVIAAFETTSNTLMFTIMMLAMFPAYQQKAFDEILSIFPDRDNFKVTYDDIQKLKYLDLALNETMRVMAPGPIVARQAEIDIELSNGVRIPRGTQIAIDIFHMHRRKDIWGPEAHIFNPDNVMPSNLKDKHPYAFIPFTKGLRNCIGSKYGMLSMKVALAKLLRNYRFSTQFHFNDLQFEENITIKLKNVPLLAIERRSA